MCCNNNCGCPTSSSPVLLIQQGHTGEEMEARADEARAEGYNAGVKEGGAAAGTCLLIGAALGAGVVGVAALERIGEQSRENARLQRELKLAQSRASDKNPF